MVILREPQERMRGVPGQHFGDDAQSVDVRNHCRQSDECPVPAAADTRGIGQNPARKEMRDGTHASSLRIHRETYEIADEQALRIGTMCWRDTTRLPWHLRPNTQHPPLILCQLLHPMEQVVG